MLNLPFVAKKKKIGAKLRYQMDFFTINQVAFGKKCALFLNSTLPLFNSRVNSEETDIIKKYTVLKYLYPIEISLNKII